MFKDRTKEHKLFQKKKYKTNYNSMFNVYFLFFQILKKSEIGF
jgi:hypothetical protein